MSSIWNDDENDGPIDPFDDRKPAAKPTPVDADTEPRAASHSAVAAAAAASECVDCTAGRFANADAASECVACAKGKIAAAATAATCTDCQPGTFQRNPGKSFCKDCQAGRFQGNLGRTRCDKCAPGTFQGQKAASTCSACEAGKFTALKGRTECAAWETCAPGSFSKVAPTAMLDRDCNKCAIQTFTAAPNLLECEPYTVCSGAKDLEETVVEEGVAVAGSPINDVECEVCEPGFVSLLSDSFSGCFMLQDNDEDGLPDRFGYEDNRDEDEHIEDDEYTPEEDFDDRDTVPSSHTPYDRCPFDADNDSDGDGICAGVTPANVRQLVEKSLYADAGGRDDLCPLDPKNDEDKDGVCDDRDKDVTTWDFHSNNLVGWQNKECKDTYKEQGCPQPGAWIKPTPIDDHIGPMALRTLIFDEQVTDVCKATPKEASAIFTPDAGKNCEFFCERHNLKCVSAVGDDDGAEIGRAHV